MPKYSVRYEIQCGTNGKRVAYRFVCPWILIWITVVRSMIEAAVDSTAV